MPDDENKLSDFVLGAVMGVGCGLLAGVVVVAALVFFAPQFLGLDGRPHLSAELSPSLSTPDEPSKASPFRP